MLKKGESPVWSGVDNLLYFVDIDGKNIHSYDPATGAHEKLAMPAMVASVRPAVYLQRCQQPSYALTGACEEEYSLTRRTYVSDTRLESADPNCHT